MDKIGMMQRTSIIQFVRIFIRFAFILPVLLLFQCKTNDSSLREKIQRVEKIEAHYQGEKLELKKIE